ncbi:MAG: hypothetical protein QXP02_00030 [Desulfurococcaceae archaeon]
MIKHVMIDIMKENNKIYENIIKILKEQCNEMYNHMESLRLFKCENVLVEVKLFTNHLLVDLIGECDRLLDNIIEILPKTSILIRLVERGF